MIDDKHYIELIKELKKLESVIIAFSGGVDSSFLLRAGKEALGDRIKAVTLLSPYIPRWELKEAQEISKKYGVEHEIIEIGIAEEIAKNPENRCYLCKKIIFSSIQKLAKDQGYKHVIDGSNFDDLGDYRPGMKALKELGIQSPMLDIKMGKEKIRELSKKLNLETWDKPAYACLLTRIPYGDELKIEDFTMIEEAEKYMMSLGFRAVRVRKHGNLARIELDKNRRKDLFDDELMDRIVDRLKEIGFQYVSMDMKGYRMGSFNESMKTKETR